MKTVFIFGATGLIGTNAIEVIKNNNQFKLIGISFNKNIELANKIKNDFSLEHVFSHTTNYNWKQLLYDIKPDIVLNSITGFSGLHVTQFCVENNITLCLANKESIVTAGSLIDFTKTRILPIDSEHSALYELIKHHTINSVQTIYITASGGPFYHLTDEQKFNKTFAETIKHPTWNMGYKISVDSATLINKCFEIIEAYYFFNTKNIKALYHPTSVIHGLIEYQDNSIISYLSYPDMKLPIELALNKYKYINKSPIPKLNLEQLDLHLELIPINKFKPLQWAFNLINNHLPAIGIIITVVNDYLIELFKNNQLCFGEITQIIDTYITKHKNYKITTWDDIFFLKELLLNELNEMFK